MLLGVSVSSSCPSAVKFCSPEVGGVVQIVSEGQRIRQPWIMAGPGGVDGFPTLSTWVKSV